MEAKHRAYNYSHSQLYHSEIKTPLLIRVLTALCMFSHPRDTPKVGERTPVTLKDTCWGLLYGSFSTTELLRPGADVQTQV